MQTQKVIPLGNMPAGYECIAAKGDVVGILSMVWLVPGGASVYAHAACTLAETQTDEFWERVVWRLRHHLRNAKGVTTYTDMALSNRPSQFQQEHSDGVFSPDHFFEGVKREDGLFDLVAVKPREKAAASSVSVTLEAS